MTEVEFRAQLLNELKLSPKADQLQAIAQLHDFLFHGGASSVFVLRGYAGTGKTTLMGALIRWLHAVKRKTVLMAPTGRSAKVLSAHSGYSASTIHRRIYAVKDDDRGHFSLTLNLNKSKKTIFIVDEASMIGDRPTDEGLSGRSLLEDLINYVYSGERCRLVLIGDDAQLPPVGLEHSPALDKKSLQKIMRGEVFECTLTEVFRQSHDSLILTNATELRNQLRSGDFSQIKLSVDRVEDVAVIEQNELQDFFETSFAGRDSAESVIICRSNRDANKFNQQIRLRILQREAPIEAGDRLMVVKNNYFWELPGSRQNFLANGDMITVQRVHRMETFGPFRFAECQVVFSDDEEVSFDLILLLNALESETPNIPSRELFEMREQLVQSGEIDPNDPYEKFFRNPWFNAVQVKYAYAITCHKSQGGQWTEVFIYQGYFTDDIMDRSYFRWLYTALTRSTSKVWLIGFSPKMLSE